jgi:CheY-like chemotaxis protein
MPVLDEVETFRRLRSDDRFKRIPVVAMSGGISETTQDHQTFGFSAKAVLR